jgi:hypothetical protein
MPGKPHRRWVASTPRKPAPPPVPEALKLRLKQAADRLVAEVLAPRYVKQGPEHPGYNYVVEVFTRWYRSWFYFCANWKASSPHARPDGFETRFARLEYAGGDCFDLAFMRYTGEWITVYRSVDADAALALVRDDAYFSQP